MASLERNAPGLLELKERTFEAARNRDGVIHTLFGRRLCYPDIVPEYATETAKRLKSEKPEDYADITANKLGSSLVSRAERQIFNALLQGTAADVLKILTLKSRPYVHRAGGRLAAAVHDELVIPTPEKYAPWLRDQLTDIFSSTNPLKHCPVTGEAAIGETWQQIH
jgi:DNA polymerase-1